ncbi:MAG: PAAR domain-containing protein [Sulfitobacter sp.]
MGQPCARVGDMHVCPMVTPGVPPIPHVGGPILPPGGIPVLVGGMPCARATDMALCVGPPDVIAKASMTVMVGKLPCARMGDMTAHGGSIVVGLPTVLVGG